MQQIRARLTGRSESQANWSRACNAQYTIEIVSKTDCHLVGSRTMSIPDEAAVETDLKVSGLAGLRVIDALILQ